MRRTECVRQLADAAELVSMLEQLVDGFSRREAFTEGIPWRGVRLTLAQVHSLISRSYEMFSQELAAEDPLLQEPNVRRSQKFASSPLAGRIQKAPVAGRIRELSDNYDAAEESSYGPIDTAPAADLSAAVGEG